jgi:hypothetical protein
MHVDIVFYLSEDLYFLSLPRLCDVIPLLLFLLESATSPGLCFVKFVAMLGMLLGFSIETFGPFLSEITALCFCVLSQKMILSSLCWTRHLFIVMLDVSALC